MNDFMLEMALNHFEFSEDQKTQIKNFIPKAAYLAQLVKSNRTVINEAIDIVEMVTAQINKAESQS